MADVAIDEKVVNSRVRAMSVALLELSDYVKASLSPVELRKAVSAAGSLADAAGDVIAALESFRKSARVKSSKELSSHVRDVVESVKVLRSLAKDFPKASDRQNLFEQLNSRYAEAVRGLTVILAETA